MQKNLAVSVFKRRLLFSLKVRPLKEGKYYPAIAVGCNDQIEQLKVKGYGRYFMNYYVAMTKRIHFGQHELGIHLAYWYYNVEYNKKWNGVVGGVTY